MKIKVLAAALCLALAGMALAGTAVARKGTKVSITIQASEGAGFGGYVKSSKKKCADGRTVKLYKQKGTHHDLSKDTKVGSDLAQPNNDGYQWFVNVDKAGKYYAHVSSSSSNGCKSANSKTLRAKL